MCFGRVAWTLWAPPRLLYGQAILFLQGVGTFRELLDSFPVTSHRQGKMEGQARVGNLVSALLPLDCLQETPES